MTAIADGILCLSSTLSHYLNVRVNFLHILDSELSWAWLNIFQAFLPLDRGEWRYILNQIIVLRVRILPLRWYPHNLSYLLLFILWLHLLAYQVNTNWRLLAWISYNYSIIIAGVSRGGNHCRFLIYWLDTRRVRISRVIALAPSIAFLILVIVYLISVQLSAQMWQAYAAITTWHRASPCHRGNSKLSIFILYVGLVITSLLNGHTIDTNPIHCISVVLLWFSFWKYSILDLESIIDVAELALIVVTGHLFSLHRLLEGESSHSKGKESWLIFTSWRKIKLRAYMFSCRCLLLVSTALISFIWSVWLVVIFATVSHSEWYFRAGP